MQRLRIGLSIVSAVICLTVISPVPALAVKLPDEAPVPKILRPAEQPAVTPAPEAADVEASSQEADVVLPEAAVPVPTQKPTLPSEKSDSPSDDEPTEMLPDARSAIGPDPSGLPEDERACRSRLRELGVEFKDEKALSDPDGCSVPYPLTISSLGTAFEVQPKGLMNCATAETMARFAKDVVSPVGKDVLGASLKSITHASAYVCRPRAGTRKLSEHAFGNAFDISAFTLTDGTVITVAPDLPEKQQTFLSRVRTAACGPFKTVLGPGSDADHSDHLHLDLAPRRNGGTFCQ